MTALNLLSAWRQETLRPYIGGLLDAHSLELQLDGNTLPDVDFILGTRGFAHIEYLKIAGNAFPANGDAFLSKFANLRELKLDCMLTHLPPSVTAMAHLENLDLQDNDIVLTPESRQRLAGLTQLQILELSHNPLGLTPDVTRMHHLLNLNLRHTGISEWPIGAERLTQLHSVELQENQITTVPEALFTNPDMQHANRNTELHENPLSAATLQRMAEYRLRTGSRFNGEIPGQVHAPVHAPIQPPVHPLGTLGLWLAGVPEAEHGQRRIVWDQLQANEGANPDDVFRVLGDLRNSGDYKKGGARRAALTARVWRVLQAMAESHELREDIFLHTYEAGTCGDGAILVFMEMEIRSKQHAAMALPSSNQATQALKKLLDGLFYLRRLDDFALEHIERLRSEREVWNALNPTLEPKAMPDDVEVKLYLRLDMRVSFDLPMQHENRLYNPGEDLLPEDLNAIRNKMNTLKSTNEVSQALQKNAIWINYIRRSRPKRFSIVEIHADKMMQILREQVPDPHSDEYQERRQSITKLKVSESERLVSQFTQKFLTTGELPADY